MNHPTRRTWILSLSLLAGAPAALIAQPAPGAQKRVYVDKMFGLEEAVEKALKAEELPFEFIEEAKQPDLKASLKKKNSNFYAEILYREKYGRNEDHVLELYDLEKKKVVASYSFKLVADEAGRDAIAKAFAKQVASAVKRGR